MVPDRTLQLDAGGELACATCASANLTADRKRSESRIISVGLLGMGAFFVLTGLKLASGFEGDASLMFGSLVFVSGGGVCLLIAAGLYELYLRRRGHLHSGRIADVTNGILQDNMPSPTTTKLFERVMNTVTRTRPR